MREGEGAKGNKYLVAEDDVAGSVLGQELGQFFYRQVVLILLLDNQQLFLVNHAYSTDMKRSMSVNNTKGNRFVHLPFLLFLFSLEECAWVVTDEGGVSLGALGEAEGFEFFEEDGVDVAGL